MYKEHNDFNAMSVVCLFSISGGCLLICSIDLLSVYLSMELQSFAVYVLAAIFKHRLSATSAGLKYYLLGGLSSAFILLGCSVIYSSTGITNLETMMMFMSTFSTASANAPGNMILFVGMCLIGVGLFFKVSAAPFHQWAPDVYDGVPTVITSWLTVIPKISFITMLVSFNFLGDMASNIIEANPWHALLLLGSMFSLMIGTWLGLVQVKVKRLLAYSTISHIGFMLLALSVHSADSMEALLLYIFQYTITNSAVFLILLALPSFGFLFMNSPVFPLQCTGKEGKEDKSENNVTPSMENNVTPSMENNVTPVLAIESTPIESAPIGNKNSMTMAAAVASFEVGGWGNSDIDLDKIWELQGVFLRSPMLALSFCICLFSMAGIPPLVGFFGKYLVLFSSMKNGFIFVSLTAILTSVISASYYLKLISLMFFSKPDRS